MQADYKPRRNAGQVKAELLIGVGSSFFVKNVSMSRFRPLVFILIGLVIGAGLGFYLGWVAWPTEFSEATPTLLDETYRQEYVLMVAVAYAQDGDLANAQKRVASLGADGEPFLLDVTLDMILQAENEAEIRQMVRLATALELYSPAMEPYLPAVEPSS